MLFMTFGANCNNNFNSIAVDLVSKRYSVDYLTAKNFVSIIPSSSMFFMLGFLICLNKYGYKTHSYNLASLQALARPVPSQSPLWPFASTSLPSLVVTPFMGAISKARTPEAYQNCLYLLIFFSLLSLWASWMAFSTDKKDADRLLQRRSEDPWLGEYKQKLNQRIEEILAVQGVEIID